ncbi:permease [Saccharicrinis sp. FJH54]|uniref:permease n=1 Tax=Saccharicrinis sp. FJH54 TaxID=3344665 RepID=UPI0035D49E0D
MDNLWYKFLDLYSGSYTQKILIEALDLLNQLWPYLVAGIVLSSLVKVFVSRQAIAAIFTGRRNAMTIVLAALLGVLSPLGSYIIIPLSAALFVVGIPLPVLMALMVSSPIINPNLFFLTAGAMGYEMAVMRVVSAFLLGVTAGYLTQFLIRKKKLTPEAILRSSPDLEAWIQTEQDISFKAFFRDLYRMTRYVSKYFFLAIVLAAAIKILVNPYYVVRFLSENSFLSVLITTGAGVPFYVCGGAAIPVVQQLSELGLSDGAVLAFFISGPVTKIANIAMMQSAFKKNILSIYLITGIGGAAILGLIYTLFK